MSVYSRIFAATSRKFTSAAASGQRIPPQALWAVPGFVTVTWFIWGALTDEIKQSVGLYYDPDIVVKRVEAERARRLEAKAAQKEAQKPKKDEPEEDEDEEEEVTAETIEAAVNKAAAASGNDNDTDTDDDDDEEEEEEAGGDDGQGAEKKGDDDDDDEEEEEEAPKPKIHFDQLSPEEKWEYFAEKAVEPGDEDMDVSKEIYLCMVEN